MDQNRIARLTKLFDAILREKQTVVPENAKLFIEALCAQQDRAACIRKLMGSKIGLDSLQSALRFHLTPVFFNGPCTDLLEYLQLPELQNIGGGRFLTDILLKIVDPAIFWDPFLQSFKEGKLEKRAQIGFAWLLHHLVSLPAPQSNEYRAQATEILKSLTDASDNDLKKLGRQIQLVLEASATGKVPEGGVVPGGRHDNDFVDFRDIAILPTPSELSSDEPPFLRRALSIDETEDSARVATHLDNQFRLLREDMLHEMREDVQIALGKKKNRRKGLTIDGLLLKDLNFGSDRRRTRWGLLMECKNDIKGLKDEKNREKYLKAHENRNLLKHQSMGCLLVDGKIISFVTLSRETELLVKTPPSIVLQVGGELAVTQTLLKLKFAAKVEFVSVDTAVFAYEHVLKALQRTTTLPLSLELLFWNSNSGLPSKVDSQPSQLVDLVRTLEVNPQHDFQHLLHLARSTRLDSSQADSLIAGLTQKVSLIQGPPGTGKSFIGSLIAKSIHDLTDKTILVVCYTNHALDDILTSLLDVGIPETSIVRLGGKSTERTASLTMQSQNLMFKRSKEGWAVIDQVKRTAAEYEQDLRNAFRVYHASHVSSKDIMDHLEFEEPVIHSAFQVPQAADGFTRMASGGRVVDDFYLLDEWSAGRNGGVFKNDEIVRGAKNLWSMPLLARKELVKKWTMAIYEEQIMSLYTIAAAYNNQQDNLAKLFAEKDTDLLQSKRIIGCTTTAAAKYSDSLQAVSPDILLVEEAGEILESHVLTALSSRTSQLILIGDHKQLRPKVNNYKLTVEKEEGYDLNMSLFERLILRDYPHTKLTSQHRMRPEISALIRELTYPELSDAPKTQNRPDLRGVQDNIVFIDHDHPEDDSDLSDRKDGGTTSSKQNSFEVNMVLKLFKYLVQQGYQSEEMVILTPYLGQLQLLKKALDKDQDAILGDLDIADLIAAGGNITPQKSSQSSKRRIRLATIDNYQGEESDIVIVSLTRSNGDNNIGFMFSPERLNVLLSRARNSLIMLGNAKTFTNSRKGGPLWKRLMSLLQGGQHVYDGLPVHCERHKDRKACLKQPADFEIHCPDGGCTEPCGVKLSCGQHDCPYKCHHAYDHSEAQCQYIFETQCPKGHPQTWKCYQTPPILCERCKREADLAEKKRQREHELQQKREAEELAHQREMDELNEAIARQEQISKDARLTQERSTALQQKQRDLENATLRAKNTMVSAPSVNKIQPPSIMTSLPVQPAMPVVTQQNPTSQNNQPQVSLTPISKPKQSLTPLDQSPSQIEWQRQKNIEGASNDAIDEIMAMTGLEEVKKEVLTIKALIDTKKRQDTSFSKERLNTALLGNPGTGKTTVARLYGKMLASLGALTGTAFFESTGSLLAHKGVDGMKKEIDRMLNAGGGTIFIDEAYQLTSPHDHGGPMVLDYLLAEMENNVGKLVFLLAGYSKEMEKFFEHNPGLPSRIPYKLSFTDYTDKELLHMFKNLLGDHFCGKPCTVEDGVDGLYVRIEIRRLGRGRGTKGFGNARALRIIFDKILRRQALRLTQERKGGWNTDDFHLTMEDIIGPDPAKARANSAAWIELQSLIGLQSVKDSLAALMRLVDGNYQRELKERQPNLVALNRVFLGSPGTGKTSVAKLYGKILADIGLLSDGEVVLKNPSDFVGSHIGESEEKTKRILASTIGKVLIIDEAYMLHGGREGSSSGNNDIFKTAVIDTLVAEIQNVPGDDRCVLLLGYKEEMTEFFQHVNPGLSRRFAMEDAFHFEDYTTSQLLEILELKMKKQDLAATDAAKATAMQVLDRAKNRKGFGNGGAVDNLLNQAKQRYAQRLPTTSHQFADTVFEPKDFDPDHDRGNHAATNLVKLFADVVGHEDIVQKLGEYQKLAKVLKHKGMEERSQIPTNFIFKGPPGTGKTTIARKMGQVYYDMGFLSSSEVVECSATDLIGEYLGHTGPKTRKIFEKALGQVLFIDEAYRLSDGKFANEAVDEMVTLLTLDKFKSKMIVVLAGYEQEINRLLAVNPGLASRFPDEIFFHNLQASHCLEILQKELTKSNIQLLQLDDSSSSGYEEMSKLIFSLSELPTWGNARDMIQLSKILIKTALLKADEAGIASTSPIVLAAADALDSMKTMLHEQQKRALNLPKASRSLDNLPIQTFSPIPVAVKTQTETTHQQNKSASPTPSTVQNSPPAPNQGRKDLESIIHTQSSSALHQTSGTTMQTRPHQPRHQNHESTPPLSQPQAQAQGQPPAYLTPAVAHKGMWHHQRKRSSSPANIQQGLPQLNQNHSQASMSSGGLTSRDPDVSDATWSQLQACKRKAEERKKKDAEKMEILRKEMAERAEAEKRQKAAIEALERAAAAKDEAERQERQKKLELARLERKKAEQERQRLAAILKRRRQLEEEEKRKEKAVQQKLREMGVCVQGYAWIKLPGQGYRCAGGSHFISDQQLR